MLFRSIQGNTARFRHSAIFCYRKERDIAVNNLHAGLVVRLLAYCIAGHHAGLPDFAGGITPNGALQQRLGEDGKVLAEPALAAWIARHEAGWLARRPGPPWPFKDTDVSFWLRMLFSCLVDADFLCTEGFMSPAQAAGNKL